MKDLLLKIWNSIPSFPSIFSALVCSAGCVIVETTAIVVTIGDLENKSPIEVGLNFALFVELTAITALDAAMLYKTWTESEERKPLLGAAVEGVEDL